MVNDLGQAIAAYVAMPETRQIAQPKELNTTNINRKGAEPHRKIDLFCVVVGATTVSPLPSVLTVFQSLLSHKY